MLKNPFAPAPAVRSAPAPYGQGHPLPGVVVLPPPAANCRLGFWECEGTLSEVTGTTITLAGSFYSHPPLVPGPAPTTFVIGPELSSGEDYNPVSWRNHPTICLKGHVEYSYRLRDIQIGDRLRVHCSRVNGMDVCYQICIHRRPGGRVPPLPGRKRSYSRHEYHIVVSRLGECEAKGLPLPYPPPPELPPEERDPNEKKSPQ
jgi:hypothetical protein